VYLVRRWSTESPRPASTLCVPDDGAILVGLWLAAAVQRAIGAYMGYGEICSSAACSSRRSAGCSSRRRSVDIGHFDNSDWHDRLARAKRDVSWRPAT
jgi:hypothetical protein